MRASKTDVNVIKDALREALRANTMGVLTNDTKAVTDATKALAWRGISREAVQRVYDLDFKPHGAV
jgi:hypothetical protein